MAKNLNDVYGYISLILDNLTSFNSLADQYWDNDLFQQALQILQNKYPDVINGLITTYQGTKDYENGQIGANDLLGIYGSQGGNSYMSPETENWLNNEIARENTRQQQNYEINARDTSLLSSGAQLQQLGLSPSGVIQVGGASAGVQGSTADVSRHSASQQRQQDRLNKYNQQMGLAKSLIGAASSMASSGIYGAALGAVKHAGSQIAGAAAHSGLDALKATQITGKFKKSDLPRLPSQKVGGFYSIFE